MTRPNITDPNEMLAVQGDRIIVYKRGDNGSLVMEHVLTLVRRMDDTSSVLRMVNRESKSRQPDWAFTQAWYNNLRPAGENKLNAKWEVTLKTAN